MRGDVSSVPDEKATRRKLLKFPEFKESAEVSAFIDHYLQSAEWSLPPQPTRNTDREEMRGGSFFVACTLVLI